jgi:hypothetical protein
MPHPIRPNADLRQEAEELLDEILPADVRPADTTLCHYTSLAVTLLILEHTREDVFMSECRYCNDRQEFLYAFTTARQILMSWSNHAFGLSVDAVLVTLKQEAYVLCLCEPPADRLSQWRGYGADGRGTCISFEVSAFVRMAGSGRQRRLAQVIYDPNKMRSDLTNLIQAGEHRYNNASANMQQTIVEATALALYFLCPIYKDPGFAEEREFRFIYMPLLTPSGSSIAPTRYRDRSGFLIPYVRLSDVATLPNRIVGPGLPIERIMVGPSGLIGLNYEALNDYVQLHPNQTGRISVDRSAIPYRP